MPVMLNLGTNSKNVWLAGWAGWLAPFASCLSLSRSVSPLLRYLALPCVTVGTTETDESDGRSVRRTEYRSIGVTDSLHLPLRNVYTSTVHTYLLLDVATTTTTTVLYTAPAPNCAALRCITYYATVQYSIIPPSKICTLSCRLSYPADTKKKT